MIRTLFWLLLLANVAFFAWQRWSTTLLHNDAQLYAQPALNADQIKLLGFSASPLAASAAASAPAATILQTAPSDPVEPAVAAPQHGPSACLEWGEFSGTDLNNASQALASLNLGDRLSQREVEHSIGYWVYIPPLKNNAAVKEKLAELKKHGVTEHFVVQKKGAWLHTISLGVFKGEEIAKRFLDTLKAKGVKGAVVGERQTRLKFTVFVLKDPEAAVLDKLVEWERNYTDINMKAVPCN